MKADMQTGWFRKWLALDSKKRFEMLTFTENTIHAKEELEDEIDQYIPYDCWRMEKIPGASSEHRDPHGGVIDEGMEDSRREHAVRVPVPQRAVADPEVRRRRETQQRSTHRMHARCEVLQRQGRRADDEGLAGWRSAAAASL